MFVELNTYINYNNLTNHISCFHLNCRSLSNKIGESQLLLNLLSFHFDFITFTESWLTDSNTYFFNSCLPGYKLFNKCCDTNTYEGIWHCYLHINNKFSASVINLKSTFDFEHLKLKLSPVNKSCVTISTTFIDEFSKYFNELESFINLNSWSTCVS